MNTTNIPILRGVGFMWDYSYQENFSQHLAAREIPQTAQ